MIAACSVWSSPEATRSGHIDRLTVGAVEAGTDVEGRFFPCLGFRILKPVVSNCHNIYCNQVIQYVLIPLSTCSVHRPHAVSQSTDGGQSLDRPRSVNRPNAVRSISGPMQRYNKKDLFPNIMSVFWGYQSTIGPRNDEMTAEDSIIALNCRKDHLKHYREMIRPMISIKTALEK